MKKLLVMILLSSLGLICKAQLNLVPNFGFELLDSCPDGPDQIERCTGWTKFSNSSSTPDYFNACAPLNYFNVPHSFNGYQEDHRHCSAFIGLVTFGPTPNDREFVGIEFNNPLIVGQKYFLSFYTTFAELIYPNGYHYSMPSDKIGLRLSTVYFNSANPCPVDNNALLYSAGIINDSINWVRISGSFIADSSYNFLIIGNFFNDASTDTLHYTCDSCLNSLSYYYVDDVCLSTDSFLCNGGIDSIPCNVGIHEDNLNLAISAFPNPVSDFLEVDVPDLENAEIILFNSLGQEILKQEIIAKSHFTLNVYSIPSGCYLLEVMNKKNGRSSFKKIIKI